MHIRRRDFVSTAVLAGIAMTAGRGRTAAAQGAAAASFPARPVRLIVPFTPGGSNDVVARLLAERLGANWGQPIVVENRPGASGNIGAEVVVRAAPDGHTWLLVANQILTTNSHLLRPPFDPLRDLTLVARLVRVEVALVVHPSVRATTVGELLALMRQGARPLTYASSGSGSFQHLAMARLAGDDMVHVPYRGAQNLLPDLLAGRVLVFAGALNSLLPHIRSGAVRALALMGPRRVQSLPELPTIGEAGHAGSEAEVWLGLAVPSGTPQPLIEYIHASAADVLSSSEVTGKLQEQAIEVDLQPPAAAAEATRAEHERNGQLLARLGIRPE